MQTPALLPRVASSACPIGCVGLSLVRFTSSNVISPSLMLRLDSRAENARVMLAIGRVWPCFTRRVQRTDFMITIEEARRLVLAEARPASGRERCRSRRSWAIALAQEIVAPHDVPPFANSAMDGFAVLAADTRGASSRSHAVRSDPGRYHPRGAHRPRTR